MKPLTIPVVVKPLPLILLIVCALLTAAVMGQTKAASKPALASKSSSVTNKTVVDLHKAGLGDEIILAKIAGSKCDFDVSANALIDLKAKGVSQDVIKAILGKGEAEADESVKPVASVKEAQKPVSNSKQAAAVELMNHVYVLQKGQAVQPLEKSVAGLRTKQGMMGGSVMLHVEGANSGINLAMAQIDYFLINTGGSALPELILYKLKSAKGRREVASMKVNTFTGVKTGEDVIPVNISKFGDGVYKIEPGKTLAAGEYFFTTKPVAGANSTDAYTFGIK